MLMLKIKSKLIDSGIKSYEMVLSNFFCYLFVINSYLRSAKVSLHAKTRGQHGAILSHCLGLKSQIEASF